MERQLKAIKQQQVRYQQARGQKAVTQGKGHKHQPRGKQKDLSRKKRITSSNCKGRYAYTQGSKNLETSSSSEKLGILQ